MNVVAYLNESSNIRLLVLYKEGKHKGMAYTQCWYQNESSNIRPSVLYIGLGDSGLTGMAYTKWCNQNELEYRYQLCAVHRVWGTREWHIQYTVLESESQLPRHTTPYTNFTALQVWSGWQPHLINFIILAGAFIDYNCAISFIGWLIRNISISVPSRLTYMLSLQSVIDCIQIICHWLYSQSEIP